MDINYMMPFQEGETLPYMGRIVDVKTNGNRSLYTSTC
ncbi:hypothetical protein HD73_5485 [Bacillus thuringiensis serovar kurstaki str. HD73]|nr:hypothetical protein HD73_5485 [Bacillus thuringiensis serovar kurstaki str. HD73]